MITFRRRLFYTVLVLLGLAVADFAVARVRHQWDLTTEDSQTLTDETLTIIEQVNDPVRADVFFARGDPDRVSAGALLLRYRRLNRKIDFRLIDPNAAPAEAQRLGIDPVFGGIALVQGDQVERAPTPTEQDVTAALARLLRGKPRSVCVTTGHGETDPNSTLEDGFAGAVLLLQQNGYQVSTIDLLTDPSVPSTCEALIMASPNAPLGESEKALAAYLEQNGRAVILTDPISTLDLNPLLRPFGLVIERGIVLEGDPERLFLDDPTRPVVFSYRTPNPIVNRMPPTFYPGVQAITLSSEEVSGLVVSSLAQSSEDSYLEREPLQRMFNEGADIRGPITLAAAADLSANIEGIVRRTRIVVFADVHFATNGFIGEGGNSMMLIRSLDWAILEEDLVTVSSNLPRVRPLDLTEARINYARFLMAGVVPGLFLLGGGLVWAARRSR